MVQRHAARTLVHRVQIDPDTFAITLFDNDGRLVTKQRLSEGEKQIFAISVLWGLSRAAGVARWIVGGGPRA